MGSKYINLLNMVFNFFIILFSELSWVNVLVLLQKQKLIYLLPKCPKVLRWLLQFYKNRS